MIIYIKKTFSRFWNSPAITTASAFISKPLSLLLVTPLIVTKLSVNEVSLWYLFGIFIGFQSLANAGFSGSIVRAIGFAMGGAEKIKVYKDDEKNTSKGEINWNLIEDIMSSTFYIYIALSIFFFLFMSVVGTSSILNSVSKVQNQSEIWSAWILIVIVTGFNIFGNKYVIYLNGTGSVALVMRWQALFSVFSVITASITLYFTSSLLWLVVNYQFWSVVNIFRNRLLCGHIYEGKYLSFKLKKFDKELFLSIYPAAWRTWVSHFMSYGLQQASGVIYAQFGTDASVATYLFSLRIMNLMVQFSNAPFYSKIPVLPKLLAQNNIPEILKRSERGMFLSYLSYSVTFSIIGLTANIVLEFIGSNIVFADPLLWGIMGLAFWFDRYGSMHLQLYQITNHIIAHIANIIYGVIFVIIAMLLMSKLGVYSFPIGMAIGNGMFFAGYAAHYSYKRYKLKFFEFESKTSLLPFSLMMISFLLQYFLYKI